MPIHSRRGMLRTSARQRGGALVEFAVVAPVMLIFLLGIVQFGLLLFAYHATDYAARLGARYASVRGSSCQDSSCPISESALQTYLRQNVPGASHATVTAAYASPDPTTYTGILNTIDCTKQDPGCFVTVTVSNAVGFDIPFVHEGTMTLTSSSTQIVTQ